MGNPSWFVCNRAYWGFTLSNIGGAGNTFQPMVFAALRRRIIFPGSKLGTGDRFINPWLPKCHFNWSTKQNQNSGAGRCDQSGAIDHSHPLTRCITPAAGRLLQPRFSIFRLVPFNLWLCNCPSPLDRDRSACKSGCDLHSCILGIRWCVCGIVCQPQPDPTRFCLGCIN